MMEFKTTIKDIGFTLCHQNFSDEGRDRNDLVEKTVLFDVPELGTIVENQTVAGAFFIDYVEADIKQELNIEMLTTQESYQMFFIMNGESNMMHHHIRSVPSGINNARMPQTSSPFEFLSVLIPKDTYSSLTQSLESDLILPTVLMHEEPADLLNQSFVMTPEIQKVMRDIAFCERIGHYRRMYLETKVMELLLLQSESLSFKPELFNTISQADIDRIHYAREIIVNNLATPCSLIDLARKVGTNEFKLKKYFKEIFGTTVFGYWNDLKMNDARQKLLDDELNISEIAESLGYKSSNHFSTAFRKYFGHTPSEIKKSNCFSKTIGRVRNVLSITFPILTEFPFELLAI